MKTFQKNGRILKANGFVSDLFGDKINEQNFHPLEKKKVAMMITNITSKGIESKER